MPTLWLFSLSAFLVLVSSQLDCSNQTCGPLTNVSFPFSLIESCTPFSPSFRLQCSIDSHGVHTPLLNTSTGLFPVLHVFSDSLIIDVASAKSVMKPPDCNISGQILILDTSDPYVFAPDNQYGSFNCNSVGYLVSGEASGSPADYGIVGCSVDCQGAQPKCNNMPCCLDRVQNAARFYSYSTLPVENSCGSGFSIPLHTSYTDYQTSFGLKVLWAIPSAVDSAMAFTACSENSETFWVAQVPGYLCQCKDGFKGDGYLNGSSCTDINECKEDNQCIHPSTCKNYNGSYSCDCPHKFLSGDGKHGGSGCKFSPTLAKALRIVGALVGAIIAVEIVICLVISWRRRVKRRYFLQNGGLELQEYIFRRGREACRFFSVDELTSATQNFSEQLKLGVGGFGAVYQGTLSDGKIVAIKKANRPQDDNNQFLNEMSILMQINHRHIVRLLGCCLETVTPLLVYEFVSNGTLSEHLDLERESKASRSGSGSVLATGWRKRLQIASQTAEALAYLHAAAAPPIVHRDVKSTNILLDDNLDAKVADFGMSRLVPEGQAQVSTAVQGTIGYLDPEYFQTLHLTDRSDVYSLGVVLLELITGLKPVDNHNREPKFANLTLLFIQRIREGKVEELIDKRLAVKEKAEAMHNSIVQVARLARHCLAIRGADRPSMREVADELRQIEKGLATGERVDVTNKEGEEEPLLSLDKGSPYSTEDNAVCIPSTYALDSLCIPPVSYVEPMLFASPR